MKEIAEDQSLRETGTVVEVDHPTRGKYLTVGNPIKLSDSLSEVKRSPLLGEHTDEILTKVLGYSARRSPRSRRRARSPRRRSRSRSGVTSRVKRSSPRCGDPVSGALVRRPLRGHDSGIEEVNAYRGSRPAGVRQGGAGGAAQARRERRRRLCRAGEGRRQGRSAEGSGARRQASGAISRPPTSKPEVWEEFKALKPDLQVMAFVTLFVPEEFLNIPTHGSIQYHPSLLPAYRGAERDQLADHQGREGNRPVDLLARQRPRYRRRAVAEEDADRPDRHARHRSISTGCSRWASRRCWNRSIWSRPARRRASSRTKRRRPTKAAAAPTTRSIDWGKPWEQIDRLIRGCNPAPGAWTTLDGKQLKIFDAKPLPAKDPKGIAGKLGEIVAVEADGFTVVCADGRFKVTRVQPADGKKIEAGEVGAVVNLAVKARFTDRPLAGFVFLPSVGQTRVSLEAPHRTDHGEAVRFHRGNLAGTCRRSPWGPCAAWRRKS